MASVQIRGLLEKCTTTLHRLSHQAVPKAIARAAKQAGLQRSTPVALPTWFTTSWSKSQRRRKPHSIT